MERIADMVREILARRREETAYLIVGVLTTVVNYAVFFGLHALWPDRFVLLSNLIAFVTALAFAYVTNKLYVFQSRDWSWGVVRREAGSFAAARVFSFGLEEAGLWAAAYILHAERYVLLGVDGILLSKLALSGLVMVINYFFSKYLIFTKPDESKSGKAERRNTGGSREEQP